MSYIEFSSGFCIAQTAGISRVARCMLVICEGGSAAFDFIRACLGTDWAHCYAEDASG